MNNYKKGFTLIELMIAIVLGLLISAAALTVYLTAQRSLSLQNGMGELQQNGIFGLNQITYDLRHVNLNTASAQIINPRVVGSGIIFNHRNLPSSLSGISSDFFTSFELTEGATTDNSDQLTVQYVPQYLTTTSYVDSEEEEEVTISKKNSEQYDCEGNKIEFEEEFSGGKADHGSGAPETADRVVVQRYYISEIKNSQSESFTPKRYALYCDAGYYKDNDTVITGLGAGAQQLMQDVDAFKFLLGVRQKSNGKLSYLTVNEYKELMPEEDPTDVNAEIYNIVAIKLALLMRSSNPIGANEHINNDKTFITFGDQLEGNVKDSKYTLNLSNDQKTNSKYLRQVVSQVVAFRNTLGEAQ
ncbi:PilW family protein [Acinetobacter indicus]|uniref:PilW family protein n=1 Tax=Acinetobacter indicus TaxID=756892 RepID=UPI000CEC77E0|nr:PilW family protein [Acinetobacter indicus]